MPDGVSLCGVALLDLDGRSGFLETLLDSLGLVLADRFLDRLGCGVDQVLRLLEPEAGDRSNRLDDVDLVRADLLEDDVELGLFADAETSQRSSRTLTNALSSRTVQPSICSMI